MTLELKMLVWSALLAVLQVVIYSVLAIAQMGLPTAAGNREVVPELTGLAGRALRAHRNMLENLVLFAIAVLTAKAAGISNATTVLGAQLFFWGRVGHALIYLAGIPWARTAAFAVSLVGLLMILIQLL